MGLLCFQNNLTFIEIKTCNNASINRYSASCFNSKITILATNFNKVLLNDSVLILYEF